jgi:23S rRNA maturation-related 3'-5' exoribonuclease YhaM
MKTFEQVAAQGDVLFRRVSEVPTSAKPVAKDKTGATVVAHSETGHHHSFDASCPVQFYTTENPFICYLRVEQPSMLEHHRPNHTHEPIMFAPGCYEIRRQRERARTPEGWRERMVAD